MKKMYKVCKMNISVGDEVLVICGKSKGKKGIVKKTFPRAFSLLVEGVNVCKRSVKITQNNNNNYTFREKSIHVSNVKLLKKNSGHNGLNKTKKNIAFKSNKTLAVKQLTEAILKENKSEGVKKRRIGILRKKVIKNGNDK